MDSRISARALSAALGGWRTREPAYEALADGIRLLCLDNRLAPRTALPAERELSAGLRVSRSTVAAAYRSLRESGHIASTRGSGSVTLPLRRRDPGRAPSTEGAVDLQQASPPAWPGLAGVVAEVAQSAAALVSRVGYDVLGRTELREAIAARYRDRGIPTSAGEVIVTTGAQSAIHLLAAVLLGRGDRVLIETPTYPHAADAFRRAGSRLVGVPVTTDDGWDLDRAEQAFARTLPVLGYLMPDFQNPTGRSMTEIDRTAFARAADRTGTVLVLDETTADLDIDRGALSPGFLDGDPALTVRVGSLGKTVWGGLRIGWIRAEADLIRRLVAARPAQDLGTPEFEQAVAAAVLPEYAAVVAQRSRVLRAGRDAVLTALAADLPEWRVPRTHGGVSLWLELDAPLSSALVMDVRSRGLLLSAGPRFSVDGGHDRHLRIPFTGSPDELVRAVSILAEAWPRVRGGAPVSIVDQLDSVV
ncbi:PLP-dependent aminotransferase family protein [Microbacterium sp. zg.B48]|uniref:MocR-like transcription factor YczR n=1 Tax=Microbacterium sp. zg.B48 TaxID=2969408 RepID=UPI00214AA95A|nr:PLP-dependent aminotransferase family protein [Microbacterium sp. zg.B48]MCR2763726.1 PLP-dependent aminotransferase family protein [Microbacterium sp. zg.B48]